MALISPTRSYSRVEPFSLADVEAQAQRILSDAKRSAEQLIGAARQEAEQLRESARQAGWTEGEAQGRIEGRESARREAREAAAAEAHAQLRSLLDALQAGADRFEGSRRRLLAQAEAGLLRLALAIAERVGVRAALRPDYRVRTVQQLLALVKHDHDLEIHLHPDDFSLLQTQSPGFLASVDDRRHVRCVADEETPRGGCRIVTRGGEVSASLTSQLDRVAEAFDLEPLGDEVESAAPSPSNRGILPAASGDEEPPQAAATGAAPE